MAHHQVTSSRKEKRKRHKHQRTKRSVFHSRSPGASRLTSEVHGGLSQTQEQTRAHGASLWKPHPWGQRGILKFSRENKQVTQQRNQRAADRTQEDGGWNANCPHSSEKHQFLTHNSTPGQIFHCI